MTDRRFGFVALIGEPNVGKSTLLNRFVGSKVAIVTHKAQTTRASITGIAMKGASQIAFVDTPGIFKGKRRLDRAMVSAAWRGASRSDVVILMVQANKPVTDRTIRIIRQLKSSRTQEQKIALAINKIDLIKRNKLLAVAESYTKELQFDAVFMISAKNGSGAGDLLNWISLTVPAGSWMYPPDQIADIPMQLCACETTREKLLLYMHQELPYQLTVETESWKERSNGEIRIEQVIYVARETHRRMIIGASGNAIKRIGTEARADISKFLGKPVHLFLRVKLRANWMEEPERLTAIGLEFPGN